MKIGNFRNRPKVPREEKLSLFLNAIDQIFTKNIFTLSFEQLHRCCYELVIDNQGQFFLDGVLEKFKYYAKRACFDLTNILDPDFFLEAFIKNWTDYQFAFRETSKVAMYADKNFIEKIKCQPKLIKLCIQIFRDIVLGDKILIRRLREILLNKIDMSRRGEVVDRPLLKSITRMIGDCCVDDKDIEEIYIENFEQHYIASSQTYFDKFVQDLLLQFPGDVCLRKVDDLIQFETRLCSDCTLVDTSNKFNALLNKVLIDKCICAVIKLGGSGCLNMIVNDFTHELSLLTKLASRTNFCYDLLRSTIQDSVVHLGNLLLSELQTTSDSLNFINSAVRLREKFDHILNVALHNDRKSIILVIKGFEVFINMCSQSPSAIALFIDHHLRSRKENDEHNLEVILDKALTLFTYLADKDIFEYHHRKCLLRRSLYNKTNFEDSERFIISRLKKECGFQFTTKLEGMLGDLRLSSDFQSEFDVSDEYQQLPLKLSVRILSTGFWPISDAPDCIFPDIFGRTVSLFNKYYLNKHSGRILKWIYHYGTVEMKATFSKGNIYMFELSFYQMCILMCFNNKTCLSIQDIESLTSIPKSEIKRHFNGLSSSKLPLLILSNAAISVGQDSLSSQSSSTIGSELYCVNRNFNSKRKMLSVPLLESKKSDSSGPKLDTNSNSQVESERVLLVDSAIVRIMKSRKRGQFSDILSEVSRQLSTRFLVDVQILKQRLENLIEREYIARDDKDGKIFHYIS